MLAVPSNSPFSPGDSGVAERLPQRGHLLVGSRQILSTWKMKSIPQRWPDLSFPTPRNRVVLSRLRTGPTRRFHDMSGAGDFQLRCCAGSQSNTVVHTIVNCRTLNNLRTQYNIADIQSESLSLDKVRHTTLFCFLF